jgi:hypothetical protein
VGTLLYFVIQKLRLRELQKTMHQPQSETHGFLQTPSIDFGEDEDDLSQVGCSIPQESSIRHVSSAEELREHILLHLVGKDEAARIPFLYIFPLLVED